MPQGLGSPSPAANIKHGENFGNAQKNAFPWHKKEDFGLFVLYLAFLALPLEEGNVREAEVRVSAFEEQLK